MSGNNKYLTIIFGIIVVVAGFILFKFVIFNDFSEQDDYEKTGSNKNEEPALTLKSDKQAEAENAEKEKKAKKEDGKKKDEKDDKKDDKKDEKKSEDKESIKKLREEAKNNAVKTLEIKGKSKDEFEKKETQSLFESVATKEYVDSNQKNNNKGDRVIRYKNANLDISDKDLKKSEAKGTLKFDRLVNPKDKKSDIKPSTEVDAKMSITFKKVDGSFKVDSTQS